MLIALRLYKNMPAQKKIDTLKELTQQMEDAKAIVLTDYRGLTHKQLEDLRKQLRKVDSSFVVAKNTLMKKALTATKFMHEDGALPIDGPTAALIERADEITPLKTLMKFHKEANAPEIKMGFFFGSILKTDEILKLATLPSKEQLIANVVGLMKSPMYRLAVALKWNTMRLALTLNAIKAKKAT